MSLQGAGVNADPDWNAFLFTGFDYCLYLVAAADIAGINPHLVDAVLNRQQRQLVVEMNIRYERNMNLLLDLFDRRSRFLIVDGYAYTRSLLLPDAEFQPL